MDTGGDLERTASGGPLQGPFLGGQTLGDPLEVRAGLWHRDCLPCNWTQAGFTSAAGIYAPAIFEIFEQPRIEETPASTFAAYLPPSENKRW